MMEEKATIELAPVLHLPPVDTKQIHPHALDRYLEFLKELYNEVALDQLSDEDLSDDESAKLKTSADEIKGWLQKVNKDSGEAALMVYPYSSLIRYYMSDLKALLKRAYERKVEKQRQEAEKKRRLAALEEINPPFDDAEKYLTKDEYQQFLDSIPGAISAFLGTDEKAKSYKPNIWLLNSRAWDYNYWTSVIEDRRKEEIRRKQAQLEHEQFLKEMNDTIKKFKLDLAKEKKPTFAYPPALAEYHPDLWCELERPTQEEVEKRAAQYIWQKVPRDSRTLSPGS